MLRFDKQQIRPVIGNSRYFARRRTSPHTPLTTPFGRPTMTFSSMATWTRFQLLDGSASMEARMVCCMDLVPIISIATAVTNNGYAMLGSKPKSINNYLCVIKIRFRQCIQSPSGDIGIHHHMNKGNSSFLGMGDWASSVLDPKP